MAMRVEDRRNEWLDDAKNNKNFAECKFDHFI